MERDLDIRHNTAAEPGLRSVHKGEARGGGGPGRPSLHPPAQDLIERLGGVPSEMPLMDLHPSPGPPPRCPICGVRHESVLEAYEEHGQPHYRIVQGTGELLFFDGRHYVKQGRVDDDEGTFRSYNTGTVDVDELTRAQVDADLARWRYDLDAMEGVIGDIHFRGERLRAAGPALNVDGGPL